MYVKKKNSATSLWNEVKRTLLLVDSMDTLK